MGQTEKGGQPEKLDLWPGILGIAGVAIVLATIPIKTLINGEFFVDVALAKTLAIAIGLVLYFYGRHEYMKNRNFDD